MEDDDLFCEDLLKSVNLTEDWPQAKFNPELTISEPGEGLVIRPLKRTDFSKGFCRILAQLTVVGDVTEAQFIETFDKMKVGGDVYYVTVIEDTKRGEIIGAATLLVEQKFIHKCAKRGRIEDVVVSNEYRGKQLGKLLIATLGCLGKRLECYKLSLDCRDDMMGFYSGLGLTRDEGNSNFMVFRY